MPQPSHIAALPVPEPKDLEDDLQAYFDKCQEKLGMIPYVLRTWAIRPKKLRAFAQYYNELMLGQSGLSKLEREMISVVVSSYNRCYYCLVAHGQTVRQYSGDPQLGEMLVMNYRVAPISARQRAMLDYAWKLTESPHLVGDADRAALAQQGFAAEDIFDITEITGFFNMTNRVAHGLDMMPNPEYHTMSR